ncbi:phospholipase D-like domain-containing protein [Paenibacillus amylolyticus]|uniref:phospholipase D family protein n=1 Tax=Paenibacillus amylolyticus TaxID=1451 RepID=UPI003EBBA00A
MNETSIYSNSGKYKDGLYLALDKHSKNTDVFIASAFFTRHEYIEELVKNGCKVHLVVRLGFPTSSKALRKVLGLRNVFVRYFTSARFHPKLYLFEDIAFIGSSNLTGSGILTNNELNVSIDKDHAGFDRVRDIFADYWDNAAVLKSDVLSKYEEAETVMKKAKGEYEDKMKGISLVELPNTNWQGRKKKNPNLYVETVQRKYQTFLSAFKELESEYLSVNKRLISDDVLPLRLEIHRFMNYIKDIPMQGRTSKGVEHPIRRGEDLKLFVRNQIHNFHDERGHHNFSDVIGKYKKLTTAFESSESIQNLSAEDLLDSLLCVNAFKEHIRSSGEITTVRDTFYKSNDINRVKASITYLLFGKEEFEVRVSKCCVSDDYKLNDFGPNSMKELYGWINPDGIPLYNNRVSSSMSWLGYGNL